MNKKGVALQTVIAGVLTLIVVGIGIKVALDITSTPVKYLRGIGNISEFDDEIAERFEAAKSMNSNAIQSTTALLYGINRLVEYDKFNLPIQGTKKNFGSINVIPTIQNKRPLYLGAGNRDPAEQLAKAIVDCWTIFADEANNNKYCFVIDTQAMGKGQKVTKDDLVVGFKKLEEDCGEDCQKKIDDLEGSGFLNNVGRVFTIPFYLISLGHIGFISLNLNNIFWDKDLVITKNSKNIIICADDSDTDQVHITTLESGHCKLGEEERKAAGKQIFIEGFSLPQTIDKSSSKITRNVEDFLNAYGDPEYILFYEKFPEEEAQYWQASSYDTAFLTIVVTELVFLGFDLITFKGATLLKPFKPLTSKLAGTLVGKTAITIKNAIVNLVKGSGKLLGKTLKKMFERPFEFLIRKSLAKEAAGKSTEKLLRPALKKLIGEAPDEIMDGMKKHADDVLEELLENGGEKLVTETGKLTKEGQKELLERIEKKVFSEENPFYKEIIEKKAEKIWMARGGGISSPAKKAKDLVEAAGIVKKEIAEKISREMTERIIQAQLRLLPKGLVKTYRWAHRARNMISMATRADLPDDVKKKAVLQLMKDGEKGLKSFRGSEIRTIAANLDVVVERGVISKESAEVVDKIIRDYGPAEFGKLFPFTVSVQKYSKTALRLTPSLRARHLVAIAAAYYAMKLESMAEKNYPVGTNAIGLKTPFEHTVVYDDSQSEYMKREEIMERFGSDEAHIGLLSDANDYYLSLTRDKHAYWYDQPPIRFHLVSPCYADIMMRVTRCDCGYKPDEEAGRYETVPTTDQGDGYEIFGKDENDNKIPTGQFTKVTHFDGENAMLYRLDEKGRPVKECVPAKFFQFDNVYKPKCIEINPVLYEDYENNYCYHGEDLVWKQTKRIITGLEFGLPLLGFFCGPAVAPCAAGIAFAAGIGGESLKAYIDTKHQWPNHS